MILLYPERRFISDEQVVSWGYDAAVNAAVDEHVAKHGPFETDEAYEAFAAAVPRPGLVESRELLEDLGLATFKAERSDAGY